MTKNALLVAALGALTALGIPASSEAKAKRSKHQIARTLRLPGPLLDRIIRRLPQECFVVSNCRDRSNRRVA